MNKKEKMRKIINNIYRILSFFVLACSILILIVKLALLGVSFLGTVNIWPEESLLNIPLIYFAYLAGALAIILGCMPIPMGLVSIVAWRLKTIEERSNGMKQTILFFLPTILCIVFAIAIFAGFAAP